jgi:hypothetical protein
MLSSYKQLMLPSHIQRTVPSYIWSSIPSYMDGHRGCRFALQAIFGGTGWDPEVIEVGIGVGIGEATRCCVFRFFVDIYVFPNGGRYWVSQFLMCRHFRGSFGQVTLKTLQEVFFQTLRPTKNNILCPEVYFRVLPTRGKACPEVP